MISVLLAAKWEILWLFGEADIQYYSVVPVENLTCFIVEYIKFTYSI